jgi:probable phosphoglycerate mutase
MNRVFYLFRHGETDWNLERRCQGHTDIPLNETGKLQALELAQNLAQLPLEVIISSDLLRAKHTGLIVSEKKNIPIHFDSRLREMSYGVVEGLIYEDAIRIHGEEIWERLKCYKAENDQLCFPGGENRAQTRTRLLNSLKEIISQNKYQHIGISTHGGALRTIVHSFLPEDHPMIAIPNCVVYKISYDSESDTFISTPTPLFP